MTDLPKNELVSALLLALESMDAYPRRLPYGERRPDAERDAARRLASHIRSLVPDLGELASICVEHWANHDPSVAKGARGSYHGPDLFRDDEEYAGYPDDGGWSGDGDDADYICWAERNGLKLESEIFQDKALLAIHRIVAQHKAEKSTASRQRRQERARRQEVIDGMLRAATAPASSSMH